jgi:hypothetical protein
MLKSFLKPYAKRILRLANFMRWVFPSLASHVSTESTTRKRILAIYDTSSQPFAVGDMLTFQEASLVLLAKYDVDIVDVAIIYDPVDPAKSDAVFKGNISEDNVFFHLASILPIAQVNQNLGSVFIFNSQNQAQKFIADNAEQYHVWPSGWRIGAREYLSPVAFNELLYEHYKTHGNVPNLSCRPYLKVWAGRFFQKHTFPNVPVTVNLRNNKKWHLERNSTFESWLELFNYCEARFPVKFIVICALAEIDERLRNCSNVVLAKDLHTGIEQDLALIHCSAFHIGAGSGPVSMAWFNTKPYLMVNTTYKEKEFYERPGMIQSDEPGFQKFWFAGPMQRISNGTEKAEVLIKEFENMWSSIDVAGWQTKAKSDESDEEPHVWLR